MKRILWGIIAVGLAIWSALAWFIHGLVGWGGSVASRNVDVLTPHAESVEWLSWLAVFGTNVGEWLVVGVWGLGVVFALALGFVGTRLFPQLGQLSRKLKAAQ